MLSTVRRRGLRPSSLTLLLIFILTPLVSCQENSVFGMSASDFEKMIAQDEYDTFLSIDSAQLANPGPKGPAAYYYCARWLEAAPKAKADSPDRTAAFEERRIALYRLAFEHTTGTMQRESGRALIAALDAQAAALSDAKAAWEELLDSAGRVGDGIGPDYQVRRARLDALDALGRSEELFRELSSLKADFPDASERDKSALSYFELKARHDLKKKGWLDILRTILLEAPSDSWTEKTLDFALSLDTDKEGISTELLYAGRMRVEVRAREYGRACSAATKALGLELSLSASKNLIADTGKAFLYSGSSEDGITLFRNAFGGAGEIASLRRESAREAAWTAAYYRARFLRALKRWDEAAELFDTIAESAPSDEDRDADLYYLIDSRFSAYDEKAAGRAAIADRRKKPGERELASREAAARRGKLAILSAVAAQWKDPDGFSDIADPLLRSGMAARDWDYVASFAGSLGPMLTPTLYARALYVSGRAVELGWTAAALPAGAAAEAAGTAAPDITQKAAPAEYYRAILGIEGAPLYYRVLAARRLNQELSLIPADMGPPPDAAGNELNSVFLGYISSGFAELVYADAKPRLDELDSESVRVLASALNKAGRYADSIRLISALMDRPAWDPRRSDYEILYPRAFLSALRHADSGVPEHLIYALIRSESLFQPEIVSSAGAVGLSQLMPSTAAMVARGLGLASYDLKNPADNLRIGASHFAELLDETGQHPLRAMWAYNAGRGRLRSWLETGDDLPDDLLLESLSISETRQYGRNILQAAIMYGELYSGIKAAGIVDEILGESGAMRP